MTEDTLSRIQAIALPDRDLLKCHSLLCLRWQRLHQLLLEHGIPTVLEEGYRSDERQQWLFGQGRTPEQLVAKGLDPRLARAGAIVTNAWSSARSAHGWLENGKPASCAIDVVPVGSDAKKWTGDDQWDDFVSLIAALGSDAGLVHFHAPGKAPTDRPHLQLVEWRDGPFWRLQI